MSDLQATGTNPGAEYLPASGPPTAPYNEDRQVTLSGGPGTQMYRTVNAYFDQTHEKWVPVNTSAPAYATVQNPDGSIHYYMLNTATGLWEGSGNNAVYNAVDYDLVAGGDAMANTTALNNAIAAALAGGGGVVAIPPGTYDISGPLNIAAGVGPEHAVIIKGVSGATELVQQTITSDVFSVSGFGSGRGIRFQDLRITYTTTQTTPNVLAAAIRVTNSQNVSCERVYFKNCPQAFNTDSLENGLFNCTITYNNFSANLTTGIVPTMVDFTGATECYIDSCIISQTPQDSPGPVGCIGIVIGSGGGGYYIRNSHVSDFSTGILVRESENLTKLFCSNIVCESWTNSLVIQPSGSSGTIYQIYCGDCIFARTNGSTDSTSTGVLIDSAGGAGNVGEIFLNNCSCFQWSGPGVQINGGQSIVITGGRYGSNATSQQSTMSGGIAITATGGSSPAQYVTINGADLSPKLTTPTYGTQPYAISITAAPVGLYVRGCNMTGYTQHGPLYLSNAGTQIEITDCAGYNDQGTAVSTTAPGAGTFSGATLGYYGPVTFYAAGSSGLSLRIGGQTTPFPSGTFTLAPDQPAAITISVGGHTWTGFLMIGQ